MVKKYKKVSKKKSDKDIKVTHQELNQLVKEINDTNLSIATALYKSSQEIENLKNIVFDLSKELYIIKNSEEELNKLLSMDKKEEEQ